MDPDAVPPATAVGPLPDIHPSAWIAPTAAVMGDVTLGPESSVWYGAVIRGDLAPVVIGAQTNLQDGTIVHVDEDAPCRIGSRVGVGHRAILHGCAVDDDCLIGMGAVLLNHVRIGSWSVVAAGAVLPEGMEVPAQSVVMGVPARIVRTVDQRLAQRITETWAHYVKQASVHHSGAYPMLQPGD